MDLRRLLRRGPAQKALAQAELQRTMIARLDKQRHVLEEIRFLLRLSMAPDTKSVKIVAPEYEAEILVPNLHFDFIQRTIFETNNFYEIGQLEFLARHSPKNPVVVDVGSNIGNHTVYFGTVMKAEKIYCFEPQPPVFQTLSQNVALNGLTDRVELHDIALGAEKGFVTTRAGFVPANTGGTGFEVAEDGSIACERLDAMVQEKFDILKIDVEGMEPLVLAGAWEAIERWRPLVWVESRPNRPFFQDIDKRFSAMGYVYKRMPKSEKNYLFLPKERDAERDT